MFRVEYGETSNSGWAYRDFKDYKSATRFIEDFYNRADNVMRKRPDLEYWANILTDDPKEANDYMDCTYVTYFEEPEVYIDVLSKGNSLNPIREAMKTIPSRKYETVEELFNKLENEFGEDFGNFHYFTKDNVDLGTETDLEEKYGIRDWYNLEVLDYRPGYYEYIITLNLNSKDLHIKESLNEGLSRKTAERKIIEEAEMNGDIIKDLYLLEDPINNIYLYECDLSESEFGDETIWVIARPMTSNYHWYGMYNDAYEDWKEYIKTNNSTELFGG